MRHAFRQVMALLVGAGMMSAVALAQNTVTNPRSAEIQAQQAEMAAAPDRATGAAWLKLAVLDQDAAQYKESEHAYQKAIELLKSKDRASFADALDHMGTMYVETGKFAKAEPLEQKALQIRQAKDDSVRVGTSYMHLAVLFMGKHDLATAENDAEMAVSLLAPSQGSQIQSTATPEQKMTALIDLSLVKCARGTCAGAIADLRRALQLANANYTSNSVPVGLLDFLLGYANWKSGDNRAAGQQMKIGTSELASQLGWGHPTYIAALKQYKTFLTQTGEPTEASELESKIEALETSRGTAHSELAHASFGFDQLP